MCKTFHLNPDTNCLVNFSQMPENSGEIYFYCSQCKKLNQDVFMNGRHNSFFICCANSHYQCLVCNEFFNTSNHDACPLIFSGSIVNL